MAATAWVTRNWCRCKACFAPVQQLPGGNFSTFTTVPSKLHCSLEAAQKAAAYVGVGV